MALSGTIYSGTFNNYFRLRLVWSATQNVANNTSTITTSLYFDSISGYGKFSDATNSPWNVTIDGNTTSGSTTSSVSGNGSKFIGKHTRTVSHNSDGTKSVNIAGSHTIDISWSGSTIGTRSVSGTIHLNTIPRTSGVSLKNSSTGEMGKYNDLFIQISRSSSSFTHTLKYSFGSKSGTIASNISWTDHEWTIPADFATEATNSTSNWGTITCETYSGNTRIGTSSVRFTATVPNNSTYNPTISGISLAETNSAVTTAVGNYYVQGKSKIRMSATGGTKYGASIKSIIFKVKATNHTASVSGSVGTAMSNPTDSGAHAVVATITDSRGRTATSSTSFTVTAYVPPKITTFKAFRLESPSTTISSLGTASMSAIGTANTVTMNVSRSPKGANQWIVVKTVTATSGTSLTTGTFSIPNMLITDSYDIKLDVYDELSPSSSTQIISVGTAIFPMSWGKTGIGVGTVFNPTGSALQVIGGASIDEYISQKIPAGANLNNYTKSGFYYNDSDTDSQSIANTPINNAFSLLVEKHAGFKQTFTMYQTGQASTWIRNYYSGWGSWRRVAVEQDTRTVSSFSNGYSGLISYQTDGINVNLWGWVEKTGEVRSNQFLMSMVSEWAPQTEIRIPMAPFEGQTSYPENHSAVLLIGSNGDISMMRKTAIARYYFNTTFKAKEG